MSVHHFFACTVPRRPLVDLWPPMLSFILSPPLAVFLSAVQDTTAEGVLSACGCAHTLTLSAVMSRRMNEYCFFFKGHWQVPLAKNINVTVPAIALLNPGAEGSLLSPRTSQEEHDVQYWKERAMFYSMGKFNNAEE